MKHKTSTLSLGALLILAASHCIRAAPLDVKIAPSGATVVSATSPKGKAVVTIHTATIEGDCAKACPGSHVWWDWGVKRVPVVERLNISVSGHKVVVPLSVYASMFDPVVASLRYEKGSFVLRVEGADGSESYFGLVYFNREEVTELRIYATEFPEHPMQITHFYY